MSRPFRLGDFTFLTPDEPAPFPRVDMRPSRPLRGADPPSWLNGVTCEAVESGPATMLWMGEFRGHGEPAYVVLQVVDNDAELLEICVHQTAEAGSVLLARSAGRGGDWIVLHDSNWFRSLARPGTPEHPKRVPAVDGQPMTGPAGMSRMRVAIGLEYPIDCSSRNEITWITVAAQEEGDHTPFILLDEELA